MAKVGIKTLKQTEKNGLFSLVFENEAYSEFEKFKNPKKIKNYLSNINLDISSGEIIGEAYINDCIKVDDDFDKKLKKIDPLVYQNNYDGLYAFKLENIVKYNKKIKVKGKLGLWNYND